MSGRPPGRGEQATGRTQGSEWLAEGAASRALEGRAGAAGCHHGGKAEPGLAGL